jgi:hypothetical protein
VIFLHDNERVSEYWDGRSPTVTPASTARPASTASPTPTARPASTPPTASARGGGIATPAATLQNNCCDQNNQ